MPEAVYAVSETEGEEASQDIQAGVSAEVNAAEEGAPGSESEAMDQAMLDRILAKEAPGESEFGGGIQSLGAYTPLNREPVYYSQVDPRWANILYTSRYGIINSGCGPTAVAMVIATLAAPSVNPLTACNWSRANGYMLEYSPHTSDAFFVNYPAAYGITVEPIGLTHQRALQEVMNGNWVICRMGPGNWTPTQHFIVWYGMSNGYALIKDPSYVDLAHTRGSVAQLQSQAISYYVVYVNGPPKPPLSAVSVTKQDDFAGTFRVNLSQVSKYKVQSARFEVWSDNGGKDDALVYDGILSGDIFYKDINIENHMGGVGGYKVSVSVTTNTGTYDIGTVSTSIYKGSLESVGTLSLNVNETQATVNTTLSGVPADMAVRAKVWSDVGGQNDVVWHDSSKSGTNYTTTINVNKHTDPGLYHAEIYAIRGSLSKKLADRTFNISAGVATGFTSVKQLDGRYKLTVTGVKTVSGVAQVQIPTWTNAGGQDDIVWYNATKEGVTADGETWSAVLQIGAHKYETGTYISHAKIKGNNGTIGTSGFSWSIASADRPVLSIVASKSSDEKTIAMTAMNVGLKGAATRVRFAVWSEAKGQDDLVWYNASKSGDYWYGTATISKHKTAGIYQIHAYATIGGREVFLGGSSVNLSNGTASSLTVGEKLDDGTYKITLSGANSPSSVTAVRFPTWRDSNQNDIYWYTAAKEGDNWVAYIQPGMHKYHEGQFTIHAYVYAANGIASGVKAATVNVSATPLKVGANAKQPADRIYELYVANANKNGAVSSVRFAVWSQKNGQDDLVWYAGTKSGDTYRYNVDLLAHRTDGVYNVHAYAMRGGKLVYVGATTITGSGLEAASPNIQAVPAADEKSVKLTLGNAEAKGVVSSVKIAVWSDTGGQNDLVWYPASKSGVDWVATADIKRHKTSGKYQVHAYARIGTKDVFVAVTSFTITKNTGTITVEGPDAAGAYKATLSGVNASSGVTKVQMPIWSATGGQDDIIWYNATKSGSDWIVTFKPISHKNSSGTYNIHVYLTSGNGIFEFAAATAKTVTPQVFNVVATDSVGTDRIFRLTTTNANSVASGVRFAVWSEANGQDDLVWYTGAKSGANWIANADIAKHKTAGRYQVHVYATVGGKQIMQGATTFNVRTNSASGSITAEMMTSGAHKGKYRVSIDGVTAPSGVAQVRFPAWSTSGGQDDLLWYTATKEGDSYAAYMQPGIHKYVNGSINVHVYVTGANGVNSYVKAGTFNLQRPAATDTQATVAANSKTVRLTLAHASLFGTATNVRFAVWSDTGGQDDLKWYNGAKDNDFWNATANIAGYHHSAGNYQVHVYATVGGTNRMIGFTTFYINSYMSSLEDILAG
jgi:hypothetical protein